MSIPAMLIRGQHLVLCGVLMGLMLPLAMSQAEEKQNGRRLLVGDYDKKRFAVIEADGSFSLEKPIRAIHDAHLLENGNVLFQANFRHVQELSPKGDVVWEYKVQGPNEIHAFERLPNGLTMIAISGEKRIVEVNQAGHIETEIPLTVDNPHPHRDTRLVRSTPTGTYLVAHEADKIVREYDKKGNIVWDYPINTQVYSAVRLKNGNTLMGTGDGHSVVEVNAKKEVVWSLNENDLEGVRLAWVTMVERLPNGNTWVVNCHAGPENPQLLEVTPEKTVAWKWKNFEQFGNSTPVGRLID